MAQTGYTPISIYYSATASNTPTAGNLVAGELAINTADGKLFYKDSAGAVQTIASKSTGSVAGTNLQVIYNNAGAYAGSGNLIFNGTSLTIGGGNTSVAKLNVGSSSGTVGIALQPNTATAVYAYFNSDGTYAYLASSAGTTGNKISYKLDAPDNSLVIDSSGNVGIGTSSPATNRKFTVETSGDTVQRISSTGTSNGLVIEFTNNGTARGGIGNGSGNISGGSATTFAVQAVNELVFASGGYSERMRIDSSGNVRIGTTGNISTEKLTVVTSTASVAAFFRNSHATSGDVVLGVWTDAAKDTTNSILIGINNNQGGNGQVINIYGNGNIQNLNNSYGALSDAKLKENIVDATPKLDDLMKVRVRNYNLIGDTNKQIGVVAQELETVFAGLVEETNDTDRKGNILKTTTKSVKYSVFVPMLIKAVQELNAKVIALEAQLGAK